MCQKSDVLIFYVQYWGGGVQNDDTDEGVNVE